MDRLWNYYRNLNLQNKLRFSYILLILIPVTLLCVVYYGVASQSILDIAKKNILDVTVKNTQIIDHQLEAIQNGAVNLNVDADIFEMLKNMEYVPESNLMVMDKIMNVILKKYFTNDYILSANIMTPRYIFGDNSQLIIPNRLFFQSDIYQQLQGRRGEANWIPTYQVEKEFNLDFTTDNSTIFSLAQILNPVFINPERPNDVQYLEKDSNAVLIVNFNEELIQDMFEGSNSVKGSFYCISSMEGNIVAHSDHSRNGSEEKLPWLKYAAGVRNGSVLLKYEKQYVVVCFAVSDITGWVSASVTPVNSLLNDVSIIQVLTVVVWILLFILAMVLSTVFSRRIIQPVNRLVTAMKQAGKGNFSLRLATNGTDEMQYLTEKYNEMGERIQKLIEENYKSEIRKKESEIMALNLQLNPHFLYNTLNIINMMALEEGKEEISKILTSLSDMLQYTFRNEQEMVVFEEEYLWLQNYLHIMQARFEGKFQVEYEVENNIFQYHIPKLLLQPLVENAIVHGFRGMESGGLLSIKGWKEEGRLCLEIKDNGKGMDPEEQKRAMSGDFNRIGLSNAVQRLGLIYGEDGRLEINSGPGRGTRIMVSVPLQSGDQ